MRKITERVESILDTAFQPLKPHLGAVARFLIVATFLEDSLRIIVQWPEQVWFLESYRGFGWFLASAFLGLNVLAMFACSFLAIARKWTAYACSGLFTVVVAQALGYGLIFDWRFLLRTLSVVGGLLMLMVESMSPNRRSFFAGLPELNENSKPGYLSLFGRILLILLVFTTVTGGELSFLRIIAGLISTVACAMVAVGFKARWSATFLIVFLSIANVVINGWWDLHEAHPERDFRKFDFFQTLSVMGGFMLLANIGPGGMSVDEKKKAF